MYACIEGQDNNCVVIPKRIKILDNFRLVAWSDPTFFCQASKMINIRCQRE